MPRETPSTDDIEALWFGHGCELARQLAAFITRWRGAGPQVDQVLDELNEVLHADLNLLDARPQLTLPPLRPAVPNAHPGAGLATEPGA